ncbi:hypothetical protein [Paenibacillus eucommiae]|uniref:Uncharacterized protein n=1 Tax=Paenibacillus eucommiae TaxID=1355755 RepID=A0ABS4J8T9_9BACL|nr:hypothetical protein [Paenibacillus eucommiae]MBP1996263.1 hypothetical protein [Paenibacillus eucommiae]
MSTGKRKSFFATKNDLLPGLVNISKKFGLFYVEGILHESPNIGIYEDLLDYEGLGTSKWGSHLDNYFHVYERSHGRPSVRAIPQRNGDTKYDVSLDESRSLSLFLSGVYQDICIVQGSVQALPPAYHLIGPVARELTRGFKKVRNYAIGPEAYDLAKTHGYRLVTIQVESPTEYDLKLE